MKILIITQYFWPENFRINDFCKGLVEKGHEIEVLTSVPNYPEGKFYNGYHNRFKTENWENIKINRCPVIARGSSKLTLFLNYISFMLIASIRVIFIRKVDLVLAMSYSPVISVIPSFFIKSSKKIIWVQDLWPESLKATNTINNALIINFINKLVSFIYKRFDKILIQSKSFKNYIIINQKIDEKKISYLPNHFEDLFDNNNLPNKPNQLKYIKTPIILFAGNIGYAQNLSMTLKVDKILRNKDVEVSWVFLGNGRYFSEFENQIKTENKQNFFLLGNFPLEKMNSFYHHSDLLFVSLNDEPIFSYTIPNKVQSYLASGKPILASLSGAGKKIINDSGAGFASDANLSNEVAKNIISFLDLNNDNRKKMGVNGRNYYLKNFTRDSVISKFLKIIN